MGCQKNHNCESNCHSSSRKTTRKTTRKTIVGSWDIAVPQDRDWVSPLSFTQNWTTDEFVIIPTVVVVELHINIAIDYYDADGNAYGELFGDQISGIISPTSNLKGKVSKNGTTLELNGAVGTLFLGFSNTVFFPPIGDPEQPKTGLPVDDFYLKVNIDKCGNLKGKTNFNPDYKNVTASCYGKRVQFDLTDKHARKLGTPEVLIGPDTKNLSDFNFSGWLLYLQTTPGNKAWTLEPSTDPSKSAELVWAQDNDINWFGESEAIMTNKKYDNFKLSFEMFMTPAPDTFCNGGVYLRSVWELALGNEAYGNNPGQTNGAIYDINGPLFLAQMKTGTDPSDDSKWNTVEIELIGLNVTLYLNGQRIQHRSIPSNPTSQAVDLRNEGRSFVNERHPIGFQGHCCDPIRYRNMVITPFVKDNHC